MHYRSMKNLILILSFSISSCSAFSQPDLIENLIFKFEAKSIDEEQGLIQITGLIINNSNESISYLTNKCDKFEGYLESNLVKVTPRLSMSCNAYIAEQHLIKANSQQEFKAVIRKECLARQLTLDFLFIPIDKTIDADGEIINYLIEELELNTYRITGINTTKN